MVRPPGGLAASPGSRYTLGVEGRAGTLLLDTAPTPQSPELSTDCGSFLSQWTVWNHARTGAVVVSAGLLVGQLVRDR